MLGLWLYQRWGVGAVLRQADLVFASPSHFLERVRGEYGVRPERIHWLPIGANIASIQFTAEQRTRFRESLGWKPDEVVAITFGFEGTQLRALQRCGPCLAQGIRSGSLDRVACVGGQAAAVPLAFGRWARCFGTPGSLDMFGFQPDEQVGRLLACSDLAFSGYPRHLLGKSGTFAALASAGLPVLAESAVASTADERLPPSLDLESWDWSKMRSPEIQKLRQAVREYAEANYRWPQIAGRALSALFAHHA